MRAGFCLLVLTALAAGIPAWADQSTDAGSGEGIEMISQRMKILSRELDRMPEPPKMDRKIMIPDLSILSRDKDQEKPQESAAQ